jgi:uncharacterized small protein (DUF1192 family)
MSRNDRPSIRAGYGYEVQGCQNHGGWRGTDSLKDRSRPNMMPPARALHTQNEAVAPSRQVHREGALNEPTGDRVTDFSLLSSPELADRIAIVRDNIRQITEQAAGSSGAADEERNADRLAVQTEELEALLKEQARRSPK